MFLLIKYFLITQIGGGSLVFLYKTQINDDTGSAYQSRPIVYFGQDSIIYVVFEDDRDKDNLKEIYFSKSTDLGQSFSQNLLLSQNLDRDDYFPWIAVSPSGEIYVVWQSVKGGSAEIYFTKSTDGGNTFTSPDTVQGINVTYSTFSNVNFGPRPKIAVDPVSSPSYIYLVWADDRTGLIQIRIARSDDNGNSFQDLGILDNNLNRVNRQPFVVVDDSGYVHVAWARGNSGLNQDPHPDIGYNFSKDYGETFQPEDIFVNDDPGFETYKGNPSLTVNRITGEIFVVWEDARNFPDDEPHIYFARRITPDSFSTNVRADISSGPSNFRPVFFIGPNGIGVVAWHSNLIANDYYSILMSAYSDTLNQFSPAEIVFEFDTTFTGVTNANFGNAFYPPGLHVDLIDSVTNFFLVWQDLREDSLGNIYFIRGKVVVSLSDIDIDGDTLDAKNDTLYFGEIPGDLYVKKRIILVNTDSLYNPDIDDGPSRRKVFNFKADTLILSGPAGGFAKVFVYTPFPDTLNIGQAIELELLGFIKDESPYGTYSGTLYITAEDRDSAITGDSIFVLIQGPKAKSTLKESFVYPNPFKLSLGHTHISFTNLTPGAKIDIFDINGNRIEKFIADGDGSARWNAKVASGVYTYVITDPDNRKSVGKIAVVR